MSHPDLGRRRLTLALAACTGGLLSWAHPALANATPAFRDQRLLMGTRVDMLLDGAPMPALEKACNQAWARMDTLSAMMSRYAADNAVAELHRQAGHRPVDIPGELMAVLETAQEISRKTHGAFDVTIGGISAWDFENTSLQKPRIPSDQTIETERKLVNHRHLVLDPARGTAFLRRPGMGLDLGGIAKLPILQAGLDVLAQHGVNSAMINGGGDVLVGGPLRGRPWRIGVRDPASPERLLAVIALERGVVASSGDYERFIVHNGRRHHHVIDPSTGWPTTRVHGVTLVADHTSEVNGLGAASMVLGPDAGPALLKAGGARRQALMVMNDGRVWVSDALRGHLMPPPGAGSIRGVS